MAIHARAPLRVSFAGGGTDVSPFPEREGGRLMNATIERYARVTLRPRDDETVQVSSLDYGVSSEFALGTPLELDGRLDLAKAVIARLGGDAPHGFELVLSSDVPPGSGLGASSALVVAAIAALNEFRGHTATAPAIAELAHSIERGELAMRGGRQDCWAAALGGFNFMELHGAHVVVTPVALDRDLAAELERSLLLCFTGMTRDGDRIIEDQAARFAASDDETVSGLRRQKELAGEIRDRLLAGEVEALGPLLAASWEAKKRMSDQISNARIEELYAAAHAAGATGGRLAGAGGGGFLLLFCRGDARDRVRDRMEDLGARAEDVAFEPAGVHVWHDAD
jgi:D-glycero-alpha-D-manno-heptose-7-phosphate kinase